MRQKENRPAAEAQYLMAAALFVGAPIPYLMTMAVLAGSSRDGLDTIWRWSSLFFLYWAPLGILLFRWRLRTGWKLLAAYLASVPLYALCLWAIYPTAGGSFRPFRSGIWPIYLSATPTIFLFIVCLYFVCRPRGWLSKAAVWLAWIVFLGGVSVPVVLWARTDHYTWTFGESGRLAIVNAHIVRLGHEPSGELLEGEEVLVEGGKIAGVVPAAEAGPDWPRLDAAGVVSFARTH